MERGAVYVDCPAFEGGRLPYGKAQLELARISTSGEGDCLSEVADGRGLKRMVDDIKAEAKDETLLLVQAYGCIRQRQWWPGLSDTRLAEGRLHYGPTAVGTGAERYAVDDEPFDAGESKLNILRVRSGADGEVPDYFTDLKDTNDGKRVHYCKQGLFPMEGYVLGLTARPNDTPYKGSTNKSKFDNPSKRYAGKELNEYCLLTPGDERKALECAKYAEALREHMVQVGKSGMVVDLPAPLHLAACLDEYIWVPERPKKRKR